MNVRRDVGGESAGEIVEADYVVAGLEQYLRDVRADEDGRTATA